MFQLFDCVKTTIKTTVEEKEVPIGNRGVIVDISPARDGWYLVELFDKDGNTITITALAERDLEELKI